MSGQIFISYRRDDAPYPAGRLYDHLVAHFPQNQIFMDVDSLDLGIDFVKAIEESVGSCDVLIAVIGRHWLAASDQEELPRLNNPEDFVRVEIGTALKRDIRVIPVLVEGAAMPQPGDLPDDLKSLPRRNALEVSHTRFSADSERLIGAVERALESARIEHLYQPGVAEQVEHEPLAQLVQSKPVPKEPIDQAVVSPAVSEPPSPPGSVPALFSSRLVTKLSPVPFILVLLSYFLPFATNTTLSPPTYTGFDYISYSSLHMSEHPWYILLLLTFFCFLFLLSSSFLKYRRKGFLEVLLSCIGFAMLVIQTVNIAKDGANPRYGIILAVFFAAVGAAMKSFSLSSRRAQE